MELSAGDRTTENPTAANIAAAIDATPHPDGWTLTLDSDDGSFIEAFAQPGGGYRLVSVVQKHRFNATAAVDAGRLKAIFVKYLNGDTSWRAECQWKAEQPGRSVPVAARDNSKPPQWAIAIVAGSIGLVVLVFMALQGRSNSLRAIIPFANSDYFYIGLIALPMVMLIAVMITVKLTEARRAAHWPQAMGKILKSGTEAQHHQFSGEATTVTTVPAVEYEFAAQGRNWRGTRISIGDDSGGANTEATLKHYPVGATVAVYYDPKDPGNCVLERDLPQGMAKGCAAIVIILAIIAGGIYIFASSALRYLESHMPDSDAAPVVLFAGGFGLAVLLFFFAARSTSKKAARWPSVRGKIVSSGVESFQKRESGRTTTYYTPTVEFSYQVHGVDYRSRQINFNVTMSGSHAGAEKVAARYPEGRDVDVHYDPDNPANAALENPTGFTWVLLAIALFCFGIAAYASGLFN